MLSLENYLAAGETVLSNLLLENYKKIGMNHEELILYLFLLKAHQEGNYFPSLERISLTMGEDQGKVFELIQVLIQKNLIALETKENSDGRKVDVYNLLPIFDRVTALLEKEKRQSLRQKEVNSIETLIQQFQQEFGRVLSPMELEKISYWLETDGYSTDLISLALREAVLNKAQSINYIDRILLSWERKNIKTETQVLEEKKRRNQQMTHQETPAPERKTQNTNHSIPLFNWLDSDDKR